MTVTYPKTKAERQRRRDAINERALWWAHRLERSFKCGGYDGTRNPQHAGDLDGCKNDGTGCICECHDPLGATSPGADQPTVPPAGG